MRSNSFNSYKRKKLQQACKKRCNKTQLNMTEAIVQKAHLLDHCKKDVVRLNSEQ